MDTTAFGCSNRLHSGFQVLLIVFSFIASPSLLAQQWITAEHRQITETLALDGKIEAVQQSTVSAQTAGTVIELPVDVDDAVQANELIVRLDDTEQQARLHRAEANLESAEATLNDARRRFNRIRDLYEQEVASQSELDDAQTQLETAEAAVAEAQAVAEEASKQLSYTEVRAPYAGIVTERFVELGESVQPGQPLISGLSLEHLRVITDLPQRYAQYVRDNRGAEVITDDGRALGIASMTFYPYADEASHTFRLRLNLTDPNGTLFPGMLVTVRVAVGEKSALLIPSSAVLIRGELRAVYVKNEQGQAQLRQVRLGRQHNGEVEILAGLNAGEQIAVQAEALLNE